VAGSSARDTCAPSNLKHVGWAPYQVVSYVNWCGQAQEIIPFPLQDGGCQFVPVLGEAR
jgi:hypothetical protein